MLESPIIDEALEFMRLRTICERFCSLDSPVLKLCYHLVRTLHNLILLGSLAPRGTT